MSKPYAVVGATGGEGGAVVDALLERGLPVRALARRLSTRTDADRRTGVPHFETKARTEQIMQASPVPHTIVGPTYFYDNLLGGLDEIRCGRLSLPLPSDTPLQQMSRLDLGRFVASVLSNPSEFSSRRIDLASDDPTPNQMAEALSEKFGRSVEAHSYSADSIPSEDMRAMFRFLTDTGYDANIDGLRAAYPEVGWQSFGDWLAELR